MKGICKGFNKYLSQMFVVKEREIEIGYPTDVKHVAHIGWEGSAAAPPSWMNGFKTGPEFSAPAVGGVSMVGGPSTHSIGGLLSQHGIDVSVSPNGTCKWPHSEVVETIERQIQQPSEMNKGTTSEDISCVPKKHRRKKSKTTSPKSSSSSTITYREKRSKSKLANKRETTSDQQDLYL